MTTGGTVGVVGMLRYLRVLLLKQGDSAFGGMIAFCIIVGDTIPHVVKAVFPSMENSHFLWLLTNRRAVIVIFILGVSYPLSLYRDIAKVSPRTLTADMQLTSLQLAKASTLALISMLVIIVTVITQGAQVPAELRGDVKGSLFVRGGVFQAIGVISFGEQSNRTISHLD